jgi:hypothetical protein
VSTSNALHYWSEADRRLSNVDADRRRTIERVVEAIEAELRRRLGGAFTTDELIELYERRGTTWCMQMAIDIAPHAPWAWESWIAEAAFAHYLRGAKDFAGGGRVRRD